MEETAAFILRIAVHSCKWRQHLSLKLRCLCMKTYVVTSQKSLILKGNSVRMSNVIYVPIWGGGLFFHLFALCSILFIFHFEFF